jgi:hypothetical protein
VSVSFYINHVDVSVSYQMYLSESVIHKFGMFNLLRWMGKHRWPMTFEFIIIS